MKSCKFKSLFKFGVYDKTKEMKFCKNIRRNNMYMAENTNILIRPTKYNTFNVVEDMLKSESPDLLTGVLLARLPRYVNRDNILSDDIAKSLEKIYSLQDVNIIYKF